MPATANTGSSAGTTTVSPVAITRGGPSVRTTLNTVSSRSARPIRSASAAYPASMRAASASAAAGSGSRSRPPGNGVSCRSSSLADQQIDVPPQLNVLKPVVEQVDARAELLFGEPTRQVTVGADEHGHAGQRAREHQRLVARRLDAGEDRRSIGHHGDAVLRRGASVAARQDGGPLAALDEQPRDGGHERRFPRAADAQVADADDGPTQPPPMGGIATVPLSTRRGRRPPRMFKTSSGCSTRNRINAPAGRDGRPRGRSPAARDRRSRRASCPWRRDWLRPARGPPRRAGRAAPDR